MQQSDSSAKSCSATMLAHQNEILLQAVQKQTIWLRVAAIACVLLLGTALFCTLALSPKIDFALTQLAGVTQKLQDVDFAALSRSVTDLAKTAQQSLAQAGDTLHALDLETLNQAIADLQAIVAPLARLMGK